MFVVQEKWWISEFLLNYFVMICIEVIVVGFKVIFDLSTTEYSTNAMGPVQYSAVVERKVMIISIIECSETTLVLLILFLPVIC